MPSWELFERQPDEYKNTVLPPEIKARVAVEQASPLGWHRWVGDHGKVLAMRGFGASAPLQALQKRFGFTVDDIERAAKETLKAALA